MKIHAQDHEVARTLQEAELGDFAYLSQEQRDRIREKAKQYRASYRAHPILHNTITVALLILLFGADAAALLALPGWMPLDLGTTRGALLAGLASGAIHGFLVCSIVTFSVHEGAAHDLAIQGRGPVASALRLVANNACRLFLADPVYYREGHGAHHRDFGTERDGSFTNFVRVRRLLLSIVPLSPFMSFSDYFPWRPQEQTKSRRLSVALTNAYIAVFVVLMWRAYGPIVPVVALFIVGGWLSFVLDRLRESTEHLFMPLDADSGTRDFGLGFWGLLLGGGPWGQPCHLSHHLAPSLPWYHQLRLHFFLRTLLTEQQKRQFFLRPVIGYPALLWRLFTGAGGRARPAARPPAGAPR